MTQNSYQQFCPIAMAAEILCRRWTLQLLRELLLGSVRFNALRQGLPRMSSALRHLASTFGTWVTLSPLAKVEKQTASHRTAHEREHSQGAL